MLDAICSTAGYMMLCANDIQPLGNDTRYRIPLSEVFSEGHNSALNPGHVDPIV